MALARSITGCVLAAALCACGGSSNENTTNAVDFVTLGIYGTTATYTDDVQNVTILAAPGQSGNLVVNLVASTTGGAVSFQLSIPATGTGNQPGTVSTIVGGHSCSGAVTVNVTKNNAGSGGEVAGSFPATNLTCNTPPSPTPVAASFSVTRLQ